MSTSTTPARNRSTARRASLRGLRIAVVEPQFLLADNLVVQLRRAGAVVLGPYATWVSAEAVLKNTPADCVILEVRTSAGIDFTPAHALRRLGAPVVLVTVLDRSELPADLQSLVWVPQPVDIDALAGAIAETISGALDREGRNPEPRRSGGQWMDR